MSIKMKNGRIFVAVLALVMLIAATAVCVSAETLSFDSCDSASGWHGGFSPDRKEMIEGNGSVRFTVKPNTDSFVLYKVHDPVDASAYNCIEFDLYVEDIDLLSSCSSFNFELTSSSTWDKNEIEWSGEIFDSEWQNGWNSIVLPFKESDIDLTAVNFTRLFMLGISVDHDITIRLDNMRFTKRDLAEVLPEEPIVVVNLAETAAPETASIPETEAATAPVIEAVPAPEGEPTEPASDEAKGGVNAVLLVISAVVILLGVLMLTLGGKIMKGKLKFIIGALGIILGIVLIIAGIASPGEEPVASAETTDAETSAPEPEPEIITDEDDITKILFSETFDMTLPRVELGIDGASTSFGLAATSTNEALRTLDMSGKTCWLLEFDRRGTVVNYMYIDAEDTTKAEYEGKNISLNFIRSITEKGRLTITYTKTDGSVAEVTADVSPNSRYAKWQKCTVNLPDVSFKGGVDGHDIKITSSLCELFRINSIFIDDIADIADIPTGSYLVKSKYECGEYTVCDFDVRTFGAVGDGKTNDTAAILDAIAAATNAGGGTVFLPEGEYCMTLPIDLQPGVSLVGELEPGTANGTVLRVYCGKGNEDGSAFITMSHGSSVRNLAIYYPEQRFVKGEPIPFPYTFEQTATEGVDIENVTLVNSYLGIDFSSGSDSLQTVRNLNATTLKTGLHMNACYDIGRLENICFSPKFWLECGFEQIPIKEQLEGYMKTNATAMIIERIDWTYFADVVIEGYHTGLHARQSVEGNSHGHLYNFDIRDCYNPFMVEIAGSLGFIVTNSNFEATGGSDAAAIVLTDVTDSPIMLNNCTVKSEGDYAIVNNGMSLVTGADSKIEAKTAPYFTKSGKGSFVNTEVAGYENLSHETLTLDTSYDYNRVVITKPSGDSFIDMTKEPYNIKDGEDITERLQAAIDSLKGKGGMIYLKKGVYYVEKAITVHEGIELRGSYDAPHNSIPQTAWIYTDFGRGDPDGEALFTLKSGAGMRGINIHYYKLDSADIVPYSFAVRGDGSDIYICNVLMPFTYNGVDFATNRCDRHYVEYIWGAPLYRGVVCGGGSEDGIVRDIQYTPNVSVGVGANWDNAYRQIMTKAEPFYVGDTKRQILYHNFTYGAYRGLTLTDGAKDAFVIAHGVDSGNFSAYFEGDATAKLVNTQLVNLNGADMNYIITGDDFTGNVEMINTNLWGTPKKAVIKNGSGRLALQGGMFGASGSVLVTANDGELDFGLMYNAVKLLRRDLIATNDIESITLYGNVFASGGKLELDGVDASKLHGVN